MATFPTGSVPAPAFGQADLSNCEREQIHLAGGVQPHGILIVVREPDLTIVQVSANAESHSGVGGGILGLGLDELPGNLVERIRPSLHLPLGEIPSAVRCRFGDPLADFDCLFHRPPSGGLLLELERVDRDVDRRDEIDSALQSIRGAATIQELCDETARIFRQLAGYDRVMLYRFDEEGHGEVLAERRDARLDSFLGQRYPASDIPQIARRLYMRNRVRVLVDVEDARVPLEPRVSPLTGEELDMSLCFLRAMSPIHIQYLKNMGVAATLVTSLVVDEKLWGLVSCHHYSPRSVGYDIRVVCELLSEAVATRIAALESFARVQAELSVHRLEQRMAEAVSRNGDWQAALMDGSPSLLQPLRAEGAAILFEGEIRTIGEVPGTQDIREIGRWLDENAQREVFVTASLCEEEPDFERISDSVSGLVAAPVSISPGEYLLWFRPAQVRMVTWGGNPFKPFVVGDSPEDLSPRRSFAQWHQQVEGTSEPWLPSEVAAARLIGKTVSDIVLQLRSVQVLIVQDQLETIRQQVQRSEHPVIVGDPEGRILLTSDSFDQLLRADHTHPDWLQDLPDMFSEPGELQVQFDDLLAHQRSFRGEFELPLDRGQWRPVMVRGDPVVAVPGRILGYVVLVSDLSGRKAADAARRRFQRDMMLEIPLDRVGQARSTTYQHLLSSVLANAQLAALEITGGVDPSPMPTKLESVRASARRTVELLDQLAKHDGGVLKPKR